jgi:hypothetical protein
MIEPVNEGTWIIGLASEIVVARVTRKLVDGTDPIWEICEPGAGTYGMRESDISENVLKDMTLTDFPFLQGSVVRVNLGVEASGNPGPDEARSEALFVVTWCSVLPNNPVPNPTDPANGVAHCIPISVGRGSRGEQYAWDIKALTLVTPPPSIE